MRINRLIVFPVVAAGLLALVGCSNPFKGSWRATDSSYGCGRDSFTADGDLKGDGTWYALDTGSSCLVCSFSFTGEDKGNDVYRIDIDFDSCNCSGDHTAVATCDMNSDGDRLICTLDFGSCSPIGDNTFEKQN